MRPSTWSGTPEIICVGGVPRRSGQLRAHELVVAADAAGGDDHGLRLERELADRRRAMLGCAARARRSGASTVAAHAVDRAGARCVERVDAVAEAQVDEPARLRPSRTRRTNGSMHARARCPR